MADINASLKTTLNGKAPQHKIEGQNAFEFSEGSDGALHIKTTDVNGKPIDPREVSNLPTDYPDSATKAAIDALKAENIALNNKLQGIIDGTTPANTQLTGSSVAVPVDLQYQALTDPLPIKSMPNMGKITLADNVVVPASGKQAFITDVGAIEGYKKMTVYIVSDQEFKASGYIYDPVTGNLTEEFIEIFPSPVTSRPNRPQYKVLPDYVTDRFQVWFTNNAAVDCTVTITIAVLF
ncbi:hypothetical protein [Virgibacillus siamensis]|uniref:hypothetical protein n=1 Tax=Virgibacillus siamensis TaxID=480071 RepID=UPI000986AF32|nr:hypothetical protein [Virgibacillus siamensis]